MSPTCLPYKIQIYQHVIKNYYCEHDVRIFKEKIPQALVNAPGIFRDQHKLGSTKELPFIVETMAKFNHTLPMNDDLYNLGNNF